MAAKGLSAVAWFLDACCCCQAFIIALTSDFIPRLVYSMRYSPDQTLTGYVNFSLAFFNTTDFEENHQPALALRGNIQICRSVTHTDFLQSMSRWMGWGCWVGGGGRGHQSLQVSLAVTDFFNGMRKWGRVGGWVGVWRRERQSLQVNLKVTDLF